jgi:inorganic pyrophosphatase
VAKNQIKIIPSPFTAVTEYENDFVNKFNKNLSGAVAEVLKFMASATASAVKNGLTFEKAVSDDLRGAESEVDINPSEAQIKSGNYKKGHVTIQGFDITVENPKGSTRSGVDNSGKEWSITMNNTYGYIKGTNGKDGDHIDVFLGDSLESNKVFVIDQYLNNVFDEHKVMLGFDNVKEARAAYLANYEKGWKGLKRITRTTTETFSKWIGEKTKKQKPFHQYKIAKDGI